MKKRLLCLILAAMILCASLISYAGSFDTVTNDYGYSVTVNKNVMRISFNTDLFNNDPEHYLTYLAGKTLLTLKKFDTNNPLIRYFNDEIQNQVAWLLPKGSDLDGLARYEFFSLDTADFEAISDDKAIIFKFPVTCKEGTHVVALVGLSDGVETTDIDTAIKDIKWIPLKAEEVNGEVKVYLTDKCLELLRDAEEIMMMIMALRERVKVTKEDKSMGNPSITTNDFGYSVSYNNKIMYLKFRIELPRILTQLAKKVLDKLREHVKNNSIIISFFNDIVKERAADLLPIDYNLDKLMMYEFVSLKAQVFDFSIEDVVEVDFTFPTKYRNGMNLIALIGVKDLTDVTADTDIDVEIKGIKWLPVRAEVVGGKVRTYLPREILLLMDTVHNEIMLAILSEFLQF